jgi:hypothetical protein
LDNLKTLGYVGLACGFVTLIYGLFVFFNINTAVSQNPVLAGEVAFATAIREASPYVMFSVVLVVAGFVCLYVQSNKEDTTISSLAEKITEKDMLDRLNRLEGIVDNNFNVITKRLDEIEEKQLMVSQNTIIKAKRE